MTDFATTFVNKSGGTLNGRPLASYTKEDLNAYWAAFHAAQEPDEHARHRKQAVRNINCEPCRDRKIRWMLAQPRTSHQYRLGVMLAGDYGIETEEKTT